MADFIRLNISAPKAFVEELKLFVSTRSISRFLVEAGRDKIAVEKRKKALAVLEKAGPLFPDIEDAATYIHNMRRRDTEHRMHKLGV